MPTITYTQAEIDALAHLAAQTAFGTPPADAPTSSLLRAVEDIQPLASILALAEHGKSGDLFEVAVDNESVRIVERKKA